MPKRGENESIPQGWKLDIRVRRNGRQDKFYTNMSSGTVLRTLKKVEEHISRGEGAGVEVTTSGSRKNNKREKADQVDASNEKTHEAANDPSNTMKDDGEIGKEKEKEECRTEESFTSEGFGSIPFMQNQKAGEKEQNIDEFGQFSGRLFPFPEDKGKGKEKAEKEEVCLVRNITAAEYAACYVPDALKERINLRRLYSAGIKKVKEEDAAAASADQTKKNKDRNR